MRLAFSSNAFRRFSIEETIKILSEIGYEGIEIMCDTPHAWPQDLTNEKIKSIRDALEVNKLKISNLNAFMMCKIGDFHHPSWIEKDPVYRKKRVEHTIECIRLAGLLGARTISTEPGGPLGDGSREDALEIFEEGLMQAIKIAKEKDIKILIEPEPGLLIENSDQFLNFIASVDLSHVGLNFDIGHFYCVGEDPAELIKKFGKLISHVHLEDIKATREHFHLQPGDGAIDLESVFNAFKAIDYRGWITVELYPFEDKAPEVARRSFEFIKRFF